MSSMDNLSIGDQIAYVPNHAEGDLRHPDVEFGFVTGFNAWGDPFCRYWIKGSPGAIRTLHNSELTPIGRIVLHESVRQSVVDDFIRRHYKEPQEVSNESC